MHKQKLERSFAFSGASGALEDKGRHTRGKARQGDGKTMKIIEMRSAPNPRRVRIFLAEKGIEMTFEQVDIGKGEHKLPGFAELNPMRRVPVLVLDDGTTIAESIAICRYFECVQPEPALFGRTPVEKATTEMWNRRIEHSFWFHVQQVFRHLHPAMAELEVPQVPAWAEANRPRVYETLCFLDKELATRPFIAGEDYSIADITALVTVDFMKPARLARPPELTNLARWHDAVSSRPSAKA
jgi:glutathione S-transferase